MRLYLTAKGRYVGTQDEAKADGKGWHLELVPDAKAELIAYLNALAATQEVQEVPVLSAVEVATQSYREPPKIEKPPLQDVWTATEIEDFILNRASVNQASNIFGCLGTRFAELAKAVRS